MAVVSTVEQYAGISASGKYGESARLTRKFSVRVDNPDTAPGLIVNAAGVSWGDGHPTAGNLKAMEFEMSNSDDVGMRWTVTITYYVPPPGKKVTEAGIPADYWEATGGTRVVPCFLNKDGIPIINSAGDPLEGLERESSEFGWTLVKYYTDDAWGPDAIACSNHVNDAEWSAGAARTWKCEFKGARLKEITPTDDSQPVTQCVETRWEFRYDETTWDSRPWDVGFAEKITTDDGYERRAIRTSDGRAVSQPVALNADGTAKAAGESPDVINGGAGVEVYGTANFSFYFGSPSILP